MSALREANTSYALITAARNEENSIRLTLDSVLSQTMLPIKWVIVSDGSTDKTDDIIKEHKSKYSFIEYIRADGGGAKLGFASKVNALKAAHERVKEHKYEFIGVLDADVSFKSTYYEDVIGILVNNPRLGIAGGFIFEQDGDGTYRSRSGNRERSVAGAIQMFRRVCYEKISGLHPIKYGGEDTLAEIMARFFGWEVRAFPDMEVFHHKPGRAKRGLWNERFRMGKLDYVLGYHPLYEFMKLLKRIPDKPILLGSVAGIIGYFSGLLSGEACIPPREVVKYIKKEQIGTLTDEFRLHIRKLRQ